MDTYSVDEAIAMVEEGWGDRTRAQRAQDWLRHRVAPVPGKATRMTKDSLQRARRGWSDNDVWMLKFHLTGSLGAALLFLADNGFSYPGNDKYPDGTSWRRDLRAHGQALKEYTYASELVDEEIEDTSRLEAAQDALRWVADNLGDLWD